MSVNKSTYDLSIAVGKLGRLIEDSVQRQMELEGLEQFHTSFSAILMPLLDREGQTLSELARDLHIKPPTLTVIANRLEKIGWIRRERGVKDRRQVHLYLTDTGRKQSDTILSIIRRVVRKMANGVDRKLISDANETLKDFIDNVNPP